MLMILDRVWRLVTFATWYLRVEICCVIIGAISKGLGIKTADFFGLHVQGWWSFIAYLNWSPD